jgi:methionine-rich copper-binding protein CopC
MRNFAHLHLRICICAFAFAHSELVRSTNQNSEFLSVSPAAISLTVPSNLYQENEALLHLHYAKKQMKVLMNNNCEL